MEEGEKICLSLGRTEDGAPNEGHTGWGSFGRGQMRREMSRIWAAALGGRLEGLWEKIRDAGEQFPEDLVLHVTGCPTLLRPRSVRLGSIPTFPLLAGVGGTIYVLLTLRPQNLRDRATSVRTGASSISQWG